MFCNYGRFRMSLKLSPCSWSSTSNEDEKYATWLYFGRVVNRPLYAFMLDFGPIHLLIGRI